MAAKTRENPAKTGHSAPKPKKINILASKDRALAVLLESRSIVAAAHKAQVGERTLRRWLRDDQEFQEKLRQQRQQALGHVALRLQQRASEAVEALFDNIASHTRIEPGRAAMLRTALDFAFRAGSYTDLAERLAALERAAQEQQAAPAEFDDDWPAEPENQIPSGDTDLTPPAP